MDANSNAQEKTIHDEYYMRHYNMKKYQFDEKRKEFFRNLTKSKNKHIKVLN